MHSIINVSLSDDSPFHSFGCFSISPKLNITGQRRFIPVSFKKGRKSNLKSGLYDTGSSITAVSVATMREARQAGNLGAEIKDHGLTLTNASDTNMAIHKVCWLDFYIDDKFIREPVVVLERMSGEMIIGQNVIEAHGLAWSKARNKFMFIDEQPQVMATDALVWRKATAHMVQKTVLCAGYLTTFKYRLEDTVTKLPLPPNQNFIATIMGKALRGMTDANGIAIGDQCVADGDDIVVARGELIGTAESMHDIPLESLPVDKTAVSAIVAEISAEMDEEFRAKLEAVRSGKTKFEQGATKSALTPAKQKLIDKAVSRSQCPKRFKDAYRKMLIDYHDTISGDPTDLGHSTTVVHDITLKDEKADPAYTKQYTLPRNEQETIEQHVKDLMATGVIERSKSKWNSAIFCVRKPKGGLRVVLDYRSLNAKSVPDRFSISSADALIAKIGASGAAVFTTLDLRSGFWQMELEESARHLTAFTVLSKGQFQWKRGAMGLTGCPASFSRLIEICMQDLANVSCYIDDILAYSKSHPEHLIHLRKVLQRLREHGLKLNLDKCEFGMSEVPYLGHTLTPDGVRPGKDKTAAIAEITELKSKKALRGWLGLINYFRNYIGHFARKAAPLHRLTRNDSEWSGGKLPPEAEAAFQLLKKELTSEPLMAYPSKHGKFHLYIDGCIGGQGEVGGLGAVLMQVQPDGKQCPVGFASRQVRGHEANYTAFLIEMQAAVFAIDFFANYLKPNPFVLHSDHKPLTHLGTVHTKTLNRLQHLMREFHFSMEWIRGADNQVADFLSRNAMAAPPGETAAIEVAAVAEEQARMATAQAADTTLAAARRAVMGQDSREVLGVWKTLFPRLALKNDVLVIKPEARKGFADNDKYKVVCPEAQRTRVIELAHASVLGGHSGVLKTAERIREQFWWVGMQEDINTFLKTCQICQEFANKYKKKSAQHKQHWTLPTKPNERVMVDLWGPQLEEGEKPTKGYILVMTDAFTKFVKLWHLKDKNCEAVADGIVNGWIYNFGVMETLHSDNGPEFCNDLQEKIWSELRINHEKGSIYWPRCQGQVEVFNKTIQQYLKTILAQEKKSTLDWSMYLGPLAFSYNSAVHRAIKTSPFRALFAYSPRATLWPAMEELIEEADARPLQKESRLQYHRDWVKIQRDTHQAVHQNNQHDQQLRDVQDEKWAGGAKDDSRQGDFLEGQAVWIWIQERPLKAANKRINIKLAPVHERGEILRRVSNTSFLVKRVDRRRRNQVLVNVDHIKPRGVEEAPALSTPESEEAPPPPPQPRDQPPPRTRRGDCVGPLTRGQLRRGDVERSEASLTAASGLCMLMAISPGSELERHIFREEHSGRTWQEKAKILDKMINPPFVIELTTSFARDNGHILPPIAPPPPQVAPQAPQAPPPQQIGRAHV